MVRYDSETDGCAGMTAAWLWVRADLRRRWRSWVVLGILAGISVGLACAGVAGARRTDQALPNYVAAAHVPDAAVLANDPSFDAAQQAEVAHLPNVTGVFPFIVPFASTISKPAGMEPSLVPATREAMLRMLGVLVEGRAPNPARADEIVVNQAARNKFGLDIGSTVTMVQRSVGPGQGGLPAELSRMASRRSNSGCASSGSRTRPTTRSMRHRQAASTRSTARTWWGSRISS